MTSLEEIQKEARTIAYKKLAPLIVHLYGTPEYNMAVRILEAVADEIRAAGAAAERNKINEIVDALESMYDQYCPNGHLFMSAGEYAMSALQNHGFGFDDAGRMISRPSLETEKV